MTHAAWVRSRTVRGMVTCERSKRSRSIKMDCPEMWKWTIQNYESGRSKSVKVDDLEYFKLTVRKYPNYILTDRPLSSDRPFCYFGTVHFLRPTTLNLLDPLSVTVRYQWLRSSNLTQIRLVCPKTLGRSPSTLGPKNIKLAVHF